jgi:uncharacterized surface protein with fasciclin (FAS1) repeats
LALGVQAKDIVDTAVAAGNFKTLAAALKTADVAADNGVIHAIDTVLMPK